MKLETPSVSFKKCPQFSLVHRNTTPLFGNHSWLYWNT